MTFRHSLRLRIIVAFCLFGTILGGVFAVAVYVSLDFIDDKMINNRMEQEIELFLSKPRQPIEKYLPASPFISAYIGTESMPPRKRQMVKGMPKGLHEITNGKEEYHIAVKFLSYREDPLYLLYYVSTVEFTEQRKGMIRFALIMSVILTTGLGFWIGLLTSRKVIAPVINLAEQVKKTGPEILPTDLSQQFYDDEVGFLAKALEQAMRRVESFVEREHRFTSDASHELRTPITVIKGAVELLQNQQGSREKSLYQPLKRIERSVTDMEEIIEALLWLAREGSDLDPLESHPVVPVVQEVVEQYRHLFSDKPVELDFFQEGDPRPAAPTPILRIAIANLIRNAFNYTHKGKITVSVSDASVRVSDTGMGIAHADLESVTRPHVKGIDSKGFGLGLAIVKRFCDRFGWHLNIESEVGRGTEVHLIFHASEK
jgi:signal transduction histidine kinase